MMVRGEVEHSTYSRRCAAWQSGENRVEQEMKTRRQTSTTSKYILSTPKAGVFKDMHFELSLPQPSAILRVRVHIGGCGVGACVRSTRRASSTQDVPYHRPQQMINQKHCHNCYQHIRAHQLPLQLLKTTWSALGLRIYFWATNFDPPFPTPL